MINASNETYQFLSLLDGVRQTSSGWVARCPCRNDDSNPSLSIGQGDDGRVLVTCHRAMSCNVEQICTAVGIKVADLMPPKGDSSGVVKFTHEKIFDAPPERRQFQQLSKPKFVEAYDYVDELGVLLFQKVRLVDENGKKTFRQRRPDGSGGWFYTLGDTPKILYNLPAVLAAKQNNEPIWIVEGEKDANTLIDMGLCATTMPGGAGKWLDIHTEALAGATVVEIVADHDDVGIKHAMDVRQHLLKAGCDAQVWISPEFKDITDHLNGGKKIEDLEPLEDSPLGEQELAESPQPPQEDLSPEDLAVDRLIELLSRDDIDAKQKIAKSNLLIATATVSHVYDTGRLIQWNEFLEESVNEKYEWVIPGLLEKNERVIVVAAEGVGKTMLARQVALLSAAGVHPFSYQRMPKVRTLTVDLENPERIIRRTSRLIAQKAMAHAGVRDIDAFLLTKPSGMDLIRATDRAVLEQALDEVRPQLLVIGPLYKAFLDPGGRTSESIALEVAKYLDTIRTVYNCAMWIEHHAPLGTSSTSRDLRPFGSAVWSRWPEFGISLQPDPTAIGEYAYDVKHFRGARDERHWPTKMKRGGRFPFEVTEWMKVSHENER